MNTALTSKVATAVVIGELEKLKALLARARTPANLTNDCDKTLLHITAGKRSLEAMRILVEAGADANKGGQDWNKPSAFG